MPVPFLQHRRILNDGAIRNLVIGLALRPSIPTDSPFPVSIWASRSAHQTTRNGEHGETELGESGDGGDGYGHGAALGIDNNQAGYSFTRLCNIYSLGARAASDMEYMLQRRYVEGQGPDRLGLEPDMEHRIPEQHSRQGAQGHRSIFFQYHY